MEMGLRQKLLEQRSQRTSSKRAMKALMMLIMGRTIRRFIFRRIRMPEWRRFRKKIIRKQGNKRLILLGRMQGSMKERAGALPSSIRAAVKAARSQTSKSTSIRDPMRSKSSYPTKTRSASTNAKFRARSRKRSTKSREFRSLRRTSKSTTSTSTRSSTQDRGLVRNKRKRTS